MDLTNLAILLSLAAIIAIAYVMIAAKKKSIFHTTAAILVILLLDYLSNTATALAAENSVGATELAAIPGQQQLRENFKLTPEGDHYSGLEYSERTAAEEEAVSDETIKKSIESFTGDNVIVAVASGSVRLSGRVKDKKTAKNIVEQTKEVPGVHEVTFNLGLDK
jgi:osmotically-inducible protein OsmY